jgi:hypothetical protein
MVSAVLRTFLFALYSIPIASAFASRPTRELAPFLSTLVNINTGPLRVVSERVPEMTK